MYECEDCGHVSDDHNDGFCPSCNSPAYVEVEDDFDEEDFEDDFDEEEDFDDEYSTSEEIDESITHYLEP